MSIKQVGVIGLGTMGAGVAEVCARNGYEVIAVEVTDEALERGRATVEHSSARALERGKVTEAERSELLARISYSLDVEDLRGVDLVVEAVPENLDLKRSVFATLDKVTRPDAILATNTSALSVTEISVSTSRPARVVGIHFFNPAPIQGFCEVVRTVVSDDAVITESCEFAESLGKHPVVVEDRAGFIANALLFGYLNHAVTMYEQRYATREDIDAAMRFGCGLPQGPLAVLDLIGLDTAYEILETMYRQDRDRLHAPSPLLKQMVTAGFKGRKSGRGFYTYQAPHSPVVVPDSLTPGGGGSETVAPRPVQKVGVVGTGTMASGMVEVFALNGFDVVVVGRGEDRLEKSKAAMSKSLEKAVQRGKLDEAGREAALARVTGTTSLDDLADVDLVVEALVEDLQIKIALFENLDEICKPGAILATTTSSLPVVALAAVTKRPQDVVGLHFFNPAQIMRLVEIVSTVSTAQDVVATALDVCKRTKKHAVLCGDRAGFIVNALLFPYLNDAVRMLEANYASADDIDLAMKKGCGYPMGPFELLDVVGLDVSLAIQKVLFEEFREPGFAPARRLENLVMAGYLGRKAGHGFRTYA
jgi:3-hydroxybutyryl-CoA dehydrogenase